MRSGQQKILEKNIFAYLQRCLPIGKDTESTPEYYVRVIHRRFKPHIIALFKKLCANSEKARGNLIPAVVHEEAFLRYISFRGIMVNTALDNEIVFKKY